MLRLLCKGLRPEFFRSIVRGPSRVEGIERVR